MSHQHGFYLSDLDTEAAHLNLPIPTPDELQLSACTPPHHIACPVQTRACLLAIGMRDELLGSEFGTVEVATRQPVAADVQLSDYADRHDLHLLVQH
ncbi:MAG TPA: hypothetical protein VER76_21430, partial [Pyrinomonadaceae bacterium]|nr:hypothetical protein [Pyrinomonadaceae bacterium]